MPRPPPKTPDSRSMRAPRQSGRRDRKRTRLNSSHTDIYTLSLYDALPISVGLITMKCDCSMDAPPTAQDARQSLNASAAAIGAERSEENTSELQSHRHLHSFPIRRSSDLGRPYNHEMRLQHGCPAHRPRRPSVAQCERRGNRGGDLREIRPADRVDAALADTGRSKLRPLPVRDRV